MKTLIKNGFIVDGTDTLLFPGSIVVNNDLIEKILPSNDAIDERHFDVVIDAKNSYVTPGFIDIHSHTDIMNLVDGGLAPKIMQGVTTEVVGQCGFSFAPIPKNKQELWKKDLVIEDFSVEWKWESLNEFFAALEKHGLESNFVPFVGHGTLRFNIKNSTPSKLTNQELVQLQQLIDETFASGVFGISLGLIYRPSMFADSKELEILARSIANNNGIMSVHLRSESSGLLEALEEIIKLSQQFGTKVHISHLKAIGEKNWWKLDKALELLEKNQITFDHYPYIAGSTTLLSILPSDALAFSSIDDVCKNLEKDNVRKDIKRLFNNKKLLQNKSSLDNLPSLVGWNNIFINSVKSHKNQDIVGLNLSEIGKKWNMDPADATINLIIEEKGQIKMIDFYGDEQSIFKKLNHPLGSIGTDTLMGDGVHPRVFGSYPKIIGEYVFKQKQISLEKAISAMTYRPANLLQITDRGIIKPGKKADLVIFNDKFKDTATFTSPKSYPEGLQYVIINGKIKVNNGHFLKNKDGQVVLKNKQHGKFYR